MSTDSPVTIPFQKVIEALQDEATPINPHILYRFSDLSQADIDQLSAAWPGISTARRIAVIGDLEELGESNYILSFEAVGRMALFDPDPHVRSAAIRILGEFEQPDLTYPFIEMMENDPDEIVRAAAATGLSKFIYMGEIEELEEARMHELENHLLAVVQGSDQILVRRRALEALGFSSRKEIPPLILAAYEAPEKDWLVTALFAMGRSANEQWQAHVLSKLLSPFPEVRREAARAAGELELGSAVETLLELLDDDNDEVRMAAAWSLSQTGGEGVREALNGLLSAAEDEEEAGFLEDALENLQFTEDVGMLPILGIPEADGEMHPETDLDTLEMTGVTDPPVGRRKRQPHGQSRKNRNLPVAGDRLEDDDMDDSDDLDDLEDDEEYGEDDLYSEDEEDYPLDEDELFDEDNLDLEEDLDDDEDSGDLDDED